MGSHCMHTLYSCSVHLLRVAVVILVKDLSQRRSVWAATSITTFWIGSADCFLEDAHSVLLHMRSSRFFLAWFSRCKQTYLLFLDPTCFPRKLYRETTVLYPLPHDSSQLLNLALILNLPNTFILEPSQSLIRPCLLIWHFAPVPIYIFLPR